MAGSITAQEFAPLSRKGGFDLIDVRSPSEFYEVHAVGALLAPLDSLDPKAVMESRGERSSEPLYVICKSGGRSEQACRIDLPSRRPIVAGVRKRIQIEHLVEPHANFTGYGQEGIAERRWI